MVIDLKRFHGVFFAESLEQLEAMEAVLLRPEGARADRESIDTIFRAAHSIKGGSATFGFADVAALTHALETLLDQIRAGSRPLDSGLVDLLLESVDVIRELLNGYRDGAPVVSEDSSELKRRIERAAGIDPAAAEDLDRGADGGSRVWELRFAPRPQMLARGNDAYRVIRELAALGTLRATADLGELPPLEEMDPERCYLSWTIALEGNVARAQIAEVFDWVEDDCELTIEERAPAAAGATESVETAVAAGRAAAGAGAGTIRVQTDKIDQLINLVGELVITESMLKQLLDGGDASEFSPLRTALEQLARNVKDLQDNALKMRMLPIGFGFARLPRIVRDLGREFGKNIELRIEGEGTEVDKTVLEKLTDPLTHLVRNAVDHGIEEPAARRAAGKPEQATVSVRAAHQGGNVTVEVADDGRGLDPERILAAARARGVIGPEVEVAPQQVHELIFLPGVSTAGAVTDVSGRGVGLDVVRRNIEELGGQVLVTSEPGRGTRIAITLPLTLAIIDGQLLRIGSNTLVLPLLSVVENLNVKVADFESVAGARVLHRFRDTLVPVLDLDRVWGLDSDRRGAAERLMVVVEAGTRWFGLLVDELLDQVQAVVKPLTDNFRAVAGLAGATILGDGTVALILDGAGLAGMAKAGDHRRRRRSRRDDEQPSSDGETR